MKRYSLLAVIAAALLTNGLLAGDKAAKKKIDLKKIKCFIKTKNGLNPKVSTAYKGAKVYFCCGGCLKKFSTDKKFQAANAHKANHQLAATGQAKLAKCVFTKKKLNTKTKITVKGVAICFCCNGCKGKALKAKDQIAFLFNDKQFKNGYTIAKKKK